MKDMFSYVVSGPGAKLSFYKQSLTHKGHLSLPFHQCSPLSALSSCLFLPLKGSLQLQREEHRDTSFLGSTEWIYRLGEAKNK